MTARARKLFDSLPDRVLKQIQKLARQSGETPEQIVERAVLLLNKTETKKAAAAKDADNPLADPGERINFSRIMKALGTKSANSMTAAQKTARGEAGGAGRAKKLSPEARKKIASEAAKARWEKQTKSE